jgi:peptidyl-prolyl cis-trans isomerase D
VLDGLISRELLTQQANKDGYLVSDAEVYKLIREVPAFQEDGKFSQQRYEMVLRQNGENPAAYPEKAKRELSYSLLVAGMSQSGFVTKNELDRLTSLDSQKRDVHIATIPAARYLDGITITDADVKKYYDSHAARFTLPETVELEYITLKRDDFLSQATPSEDDLKARFDEKVKANAANEQREAQHILITVDAKVKAEDALKKIQEVEKRARAGEDFGKLAKEFSQDPGSVASGGDLGFASRGQFVPEFEKTLFSLKEGEISAPVKTQYGYHLIKLNHIQAPEVLSFEKLRPELLAQARESAADELFNDQIEKLDAAVYEASDLKEPAEKFKRDIQHTPAFTQSGDTTGLAANKTILAAAFSDDVLKDGKTSQHLSLPDGSMVWIRIAKHSPSRVQPLTEVSTSVRNDLLIERASEKAKAVADKVIKALAAGQSLAEVAGVDQLTWQDYPASTRRTQLNNADAVHAAFRLPRPAAGKISADAVAQGSAWLLIAVSKVEEGQPAPAAEVAQLRNVLSENRTRLEFDDYARSLREHAKIKLKKQSETTAEN